MKKAHSAGSAALAATLVAALSAHAALGDVDGTFRMATFEGFSCRNSPTLLSNDSMLVHLWDQRTPSSDPAFRHAISKLKPDGTVDTRYGQNGIAEFVVPNNAHNLLPLGDGRVLAVGSAATRLLENGAVDPSYGQAGTTEPFFFSNATYIQGAAVLPDGTLMVGATVGWEITFTWFTPSGQRALDYGSAGRLTIPLTVGEAVYAWALQADGSVQVASHTSPGVPAITMRSGRVTNFGIIATTQISFVHGAMPAPGIAAWTSNNVKVDGFGGLVIAGSEFGPSLAQARVRLTRFGPDGAIDLTFGVNGSVLATTIGNEGQSGARETAAALWAVPGGGWTLAVDATRTYGIGFTRTAVFDKRLLRFTPAGSLDSAFPQGRPLEAGPVTQNDNGSLLAAHSTLALAQSTCTVKRLVADVPRTEATVVEYFHPALNHYFMTIEGLEAGILDDNRAAMGWVRTGKRFGAWAAAPVPGATRLCRFYGDLSAGPNSHFYIPQGAGCEGLRQLEAQAAIGTRAWRLEGIVFSATEKAAEGCPGALAPVYRFYNRGYEQGIDSNHRYSADPSVTAEMTAKGWAPEGIAFCAPPASARQPVVAF